MPRVYGSALHGCYGKQEINIFSTMNKLMRKGWSRKLKGEFGVGASSKFFFEIVQIFRLGG